MPPTVSGSENGVRPVIARMGHTGPRRPVRARLQQRGVTARDQATETGYVSERDSIG
ncbi:MAG: hypothetical protein M8354_05450 [Halalkalicoccus sp.]|nr:hypothetical protein [Halalkalicoccus sp.]